MHPLSSVSALSSTVVITPITLALRRRRRSQTARDPPRAATLLEDRLSAPHPRISAAVNIERLSRGPPLAGALGGGIRAREEHSMNRSVRCCGRGIIWQRAPPAPEAIYREACGLSPSGGHSSAPGLVHGDREGVPCKPSHSAPAAELEGRARKG